MPTAPSRLRSPAPRPTTGIRPGHPTDGGSPSPASPVNDVEPAWSPDGSKILFMSTRDGMPQIYVMNVDGSGQRNLLKSADVDAEPSWSPDGTKIVFDRLGRNGIEIVVADADGTHEVTVGVACVG